MQRKPKTCVYSILESLLKRKWFLVILHEVNAGSVGMESIARGAPEMPINILNSRLRTLLRYGLVARSFNTSGGERVVYSLTIFGKRVSTILAEIEELNAQFGLGIKPADEGKKANHAEPFVRRRAASLKAEFMVAHEAQPTLNLDGSLVRSVTMK